MLKPPSIPSDPQRPITQDFPALRREALDWLQQWCHETWTDFNESDPGVTLMEALCYALTDLGLRAELPIPRLLNLPEGPDPAASWPDTCLYLPEQVFPMEPLTMEDYRRLILDQCLDVLEARCEPLPAKAASGLLDIAGRHVASVLLDPDRISEDAAGPRLQEIERLLNRHRNLGERFERVKPIPVVRFALRGRFTLVSGHAPDRVLADAYLEVRRALLPAVEHRNGPDLQATGLSPSDVLVGPMLRHGWINPACGPLARPWHDVEQRTLDALRRVPGLREFQIEFLHPESLADDAVRLLAGEFELSTNASGPSRNAILLDQAPTLENLEARVVQLIQTGILASERQIAASLNRQSFRPPNEGALHGLDVQTFEPIGNGLPRIYGIGPGGAFEAADPLRRARARQLLGFLLFFEQLAADQATQLAHVRDLLSHRSQETTYFTQPLYHVPGVFPLLKDSSPALTSREGSGSQRHARELEYASDPANAYAQGLQDLAYPPRQFRRRRARFLDHLLARFGESYPPVDPATQETLANKEWILGALPTLGSRRALGRHSHPDRPSTRSGLEERIELLLRRDDRSNVLPDHDPEIGRSAAPVPVAPSHFHFLVEHLLFIPKGSPEPPVGASTTHFALGLFRSRLTHVLLNWTVRPLNPAFQRTTEDLIRAQVGVHLESRFLWFERAEFGVRPAGEAPSLRYRDLATLHEQWIEAGSPPLKLAAPPDADAITVHSDDVAARLFGLLTQSEGPAHIWPES